MSDRSLTPEELALREMEQTMPLPAYHAWAERHQATIYAALRSASREPREAQQYGNSASATNHLVISGEPAPRELSERDIWKQDYGDYERERQERVNATTTVEWGKWLAFIDAADMVAAELTRVAAERDRQYDENVERIAAQGKAEHELSEVRKWLRANGRHADEQHFIFKGAQWKEGDEARCTCGLSEALGFPPAVPEGAPKMSRETLSALKGVRRHE